MDVTGIRDNFDATQFYRKMTQLGVDVAYHSHRAVIPGTGCHTNAWRVYFADDAIPDALRINGDPVNQIKFQKHHYRVYFKGTKGTAVFEDDGEDDEYANATLLDPPMSMEVNAPFQEVSCRKKRKERSRSPPKTLADFATPNFFEVLRIHNGGFDTIQWTADQDIVTLIPTFEPRVLSEDQRNQCVTTMHQLENSISFDVEMMSIGRLHEILEESIAQVHAHDLADTERTFAEAVADDMSGLSQLVLKGQADKVWIQVQKKHLSANVALHGMTKSDPAMLMSVVQLHTWQRWFAASSGRNVQSFSDTWRQIYGKTRISNSQLQSRRDELLVSTAGDTLEPATTSQLLVEDALSLFELWLSIMAPTFFQRDAWVLCLTGQPVIWLPSGGGRLLTPNTLLRILQSPLGHSVVERLVAQLPDDDTVRQLTSMSAWNQVYDDDLTLAVTKEDTDRVLRLVQLGLARPVRRN
ncbi:hypothetical protein DYB32_008964 [Aphanomyces invadans]|uniref:Uncharacterized protein n=1 Tax=Aphanomyces invadans TaxID=157072 RepID=A0A3R6YYF7_9STRA|nr:hypothetical protein DYB32_008964 [Aphanomyces invadans]